jgi:hypothetical protein
MKLENSQQILEKYSNMKFHGNPSSGSRSIPRVLTNGRTDRRTDGKSDMMKVIVAFRNFAYAPKQYINFLNFHKIVMHMCIATEHNQKGQSVFHVSLLTKEKFRITLFCQFACMKLTGRYVSSPLFTI